MNKEKGSSLEENWLRVYPLNDYGAIATGEHTFYLFIDNQKSKVITKAKFTHVWNFENDEWKISRTLSYTHQPASEFQLSGETLKLYEGNYQAFD